MAMKYGLKLRNNHERLENHFQDKCNDGNDSEKEIPLQQTKKEIPTMDIEIETGDTLQAIAIRFHCTIAELKRINNILRENEIFARRTVKVPIRPHSLLTEKVVGVHISGSNSPIKMNHTSQLINIDTEILEEKLKNTSASAGINKNCDNKPSDLHVLKDLIFNSVSNNIHKSENDITNDAAADDDDDVDSFSNEKVKLLPPNTKLVSERKNNDLSFRGDDCGLSWLVLVIFILVIGFACPLIYILYIAEHPEKYHHHR